MIHSIILLLVFGNLGKCFCSAFALKKKKTYTHSLYPLSRVHELLARVCNMHCNNYHKSLSYGDHVVDTTESLCNL